MRFVAAFFLVASLIVQLLLGVLHVAASKYQQMRAESDVSSENGDFSSVAGDLGVPKEELDRMHAPTKAKIAGVGRAQLLLGIGQLASAALQLVALVLVLVRRGRTLAIILIALALTGSLVAIGLHFLKLGLLNAVLLALALGSGLLARGRAPRVTTT